MQRWRWSTMHKLCLIIWITLWVTSLAASAFITAMTFNTYVTKNNITICSTTITTIRARITCMSACAIITTSAFKTPTITKSKATTSTNYAILARTNSTSVATSTTIAVSIASQAPSTTGTASSTSTIATTSTATIATSTIRRTAIATATIKNISVNDFLFWNMF